MIWRGRYLDTLISNPKLDQIEAQSILNFAVQTFPMSEPVIGGFGFSCASQIGIWRKLLESALSIQPVELWIGCEHQILREHLPPSRQEKSYFIAEDAWPGLRHEGASQSFALIPGSHSQMLAALGLPTEEGLDAVVEFYRSGSVVADVQ